MTDDNNLLPSKRAEKQEEDKAASIDRSNRQTSMLREDLGLTFQTDHGKRVLSLIMERCGWGRPPLGAKPDGTVDPLLTTHNAMELSFYIFLRRHISTDILKQVEYGQIKPSGWLDPEDQVKRVTSKSKSKKKG